MPYMVYGRQSHKLFSNFFSEIIAFNMFSTLVLIEFSHNVNIGQNDHSNPYRESTTVLSDFLIISEHLYTSADMCGV